ncbi:MAG: hypothetical protein AAF206_02645 [Bacteroidota bacterium]
MNKRHLLLFLIILPCFTPLLPIEVPYSFDGTGKIYPAREWVLTKDADGGMVSTLYNHEKGVVSGVTTYKFERGDIANLHIDEYSSETGIILQGDTVANIRSYLLEQRIQELTNQLDIEKARLLNERAGAKPPVIAEAKEKLALAEQQMVLAQQNFDREKELFAQGVTAEAVFNVVENDYALAKIQIKIARNSLEAARMGRKPEAIAFINTNIQAVEKELNFLKTKRTGYHIVAPMGGKIRFNIATNQVLQVHDTSSLILTLPVMIQNRYYANPGKKISFRLPGIDTEFKAEIIATNDQVEIIEGKQVIFVKARIERPKANWNIMTGTIVQCKVLGGQIDLWDYIKKTVMRKS